MQTNVIDIIVYLARQLNSGVDIQEIDNKPLNAYNKAEIGAAYSWIIQKYGISEMPNESNSQDENTDSGNEAFTEQYPKHNFSPPAELSKYMQRSYDPIGNILEKLKKSHPQRILHPAEEMILPTESYGYLLELHYIGLINQDQLELIIERIMLNHEDSGGLGKLKQMIVEIVFGESKFEGSDQSSYLTGNETIH